ncbi:hypothetical protein ACMGG3_09880 [Enterobacter sp. BNK-18]|uniref:tail fiber/spike domain-containing protein n=1 Tax=Enterobacter sp. BNK-18 TaxID=3376155 RepID=UPI0039BF206C
MATQPTNLPVPSESPRDLKFNAGKIDEFVTSLVNTYVDRFGNEHYTIEGLRWLAQQAIAQYGWIPVGTFQAGATLTLPNQILKDTTDGEYYRWDGSFLPDGKVVSNGSTPGTTGGIGVGAWISVGDSTLRALLASANGAAQVGTSHRGLLSSDLNAIDRRPSGYGDSVSAVLGNGHDVHIDEQYAINDAAVLGDGQVIFGAGGSLNTVSPASYAVYIDNQRISAARAMLLDLNLTGTVTPEGSPGYSVLVRETQDNVIANMHSSGFTGGVEANQTKWLQVRGIRVTDSVYHPSRTAGGYAVVTGNSENSLIDGVMFDASSGNDGRHMIYISRYDRTDGGYDGSKNTIATNMIAQYQGKDDRNFPAINSRKSDKTIISNFIIDGANGGVASNVQNGNILTQLVGNGIVNVLKYVDGTTVYGVGQQTVDTYTHIGFLYHDLMVEVKPKVQDGSLNYQDCVAFNIVGQHGLVTDCVTNVARSGRPFYIGAGATNVTIDGVVDYISDNGTGTITPMFTFTGPCSNISIKNIRTSRPMFSGLSNVTDMTVDWVRRATITITSGAAVISNDTYGIVSSVNAGASAITIVLASHVTQDSTITARIIPRTANHLIISTTSNKTLGVSAYTITGTAVTPSISSLTFDVILQS